MASGQVLDRYNKDYNPTTATPAARRPSGSHRPNLKVAARRPRGDAPAARPRVSPAVVTSNLPFDEWTSVFGSERLTGALLDQLIHHVHIL